MEVMNMIADEFFATRSFEGFAAILRVLQEHISQNYSNIKIFLVAGIAVFVFYLLKKYETLVNRNHENAFIFKVKDENKLLNEVHICSTIDDNQLLRLQMNITFQLSNDRQHMNRCFNLIMETPSVVNIPREPFGFTPFLNACWAGCTPLVRFMLTSGANAKRKTKNGDSALLLAVQALIDFETDPAELRLLNILYSEGCGVNEANYNYGHTCLHLAAAAGNTQIVKWLLDHGADVTLKTTSGETALQLAENGGHVDIVQMLSPQLSKRKRQ